MFAVHALFFFCQLYFTTAKIWQTGDFDQLLPPDLSCGYPDATIRSAIMRATTEECRREIAFVNCRDKQEHLYPTKLQSSCPLNDANKFGELYGCFAFDPKAGGIRQIFNESESEMDTDENTPEFCVNHCYKHGAELAATLRTACFCLNEYDIANDSAKVPVSKCLVYPCPGNESFACGGKLAVTIYRTGLYLYLHLRPDPPLSYEEPKDWAEIAKPENQAKVLFLLILNGRHVRQIRRFINLIFSPVHYYYIHVDERQEYLYRELLPIEGIVDNIRFSRNRFPATWGGAKFLHLILTAVQDVLEQHPQWDWDFIVNLSETDFPLLIVEEYGSFLYNHKDKNFITFDTRPPDQMIMGETIENLFYECDNRMWALRNRKLPIGVRAAAGMNWMTLSRKFMEYVTYSDTKLVTGLKAYYNFSALSLEHFFHAVIVNSEFCGTIQHNALRVAMQKLDLTKCECQYDDFADLCACVPNVIQIQDTDIIAQDVSRILLNFFGRKFDPIVSQVVVFGVENNLLMHYGDRPALKQYYKRYPERLLNLEYRRMAPKLDHRQNIPGFHGYWLNLYHKHDVTPKPTSVMVSLVNGLARLSQTAAINHALFHSRTFFQVSPNDPCIKAENWRPEPQELTLYRILDQKTRLLMLFTTACTNHLGVRLRTNIEASIRRLPVRRKYYKKGESRLLDIEVGTNFDRTELFFRNLGGGIGIMDTPSLRLEFGNSGRKFPPLLNVTIQWLDPYDNVRSESNGTINNTATILNSEYSDNAKEVYLSLEEDNRLDDLTLLPPLYPPGIWTGRVLFSENYTVIAEVDFPVIPTAADEERLKNSAGNLRLWEMKNQEVIISPAHTINVDITQFTQDTITDSILALFYEAHAACFVTDDLVAFGRFSPHLKSGKCPAQDRRYTMLQDCSRVEFSSRFPDPKSEFNPNLKIDI